jgi:hypothetical protein
MLGQTLGEGSSLDLFWAALTHLCHDIYGWNARHESSYSTLRHDM